MQEASTTAQPDRAPQLVLFSAETREGIAAALSVADGNDPAVLAQVSARPPAGPHRLAILAATREELADRIARVRAALAEGTRPRLNLANTIFYGDLDAEAPAPVAVVFPGYGARTAAMSDELVQRFPAVCGQLVAAWPESAGGEGGALSRQLDAIVRADLAAWAVLAAAGVRPVAMAGHSFGENAALVASGLVPDPRSLLRVLRDIARAGGGSADAVGMIALTAASRPIVDELMAGHPGRYAVSLDNCPQQLVVWGGRGDLAALEARVKSRGDLCFHLDGLTVPAHTAFFPMDAAALAGEYARLDLAVATPPVWSCATGQPLPPDPAAIRAVLAEQWRTTIRFRETIEALYASGVRTFVEAGPGGYLTGFIRDTLRGRQATAVAMNADRQPPLRALHAALGLLFSLGVASDLGFITAASAEAPSVVPAPPAAAIPAAPEGPGPMIGAIAEVLTLVVAEVSSLLGQDDPAAIDPASGFFEIGLTSITALELVARLEQTLGGSLPDTLPFDYPTPASLAAHLAGRRPPERRCLSGRPSPGSREPIAIIGMACRFPGGANDPATYWDHLARGVEAVTGVPADRWNPDDFEHYLEEDDRPRARFGAFLDDVRGFDAAFFGISPREALTLDPQQRILLEVTWEALEDAAIDPSSMAGTATGVFVGISTAEYAQRLTPRERLGARGYIGSGNAASTAAGRVSFVLGLNGPAMAVDTACSSSLVALHLACRGLRDGDCDVALAGGVNVLANPEMTLLLSNARALSPRGRCRTFDAGADGYVRGEGCGVVVLKRLADARAGGDRILAIVRGTAVNHAGHTSGLTVPSGPAEQAVVRRALEDAGVAASEISFVETHGTGTSLGDPIEVQALGEVFMGRGDPLALGAVKTSIGHLEAAAGIAGLLKIVLQLRHRQLAPTLHLESLNPRVDWGRLPVTPVRVLSAWAAHPRIAGLSSFGISGTNAHAIIEDAPAAPAAASNSGPQVLTLSAGSVEALRSSARRVADRLRADGAPDLADAARTLNTGRAPLARRYACVVPSSADAVVDLLAFASSDAEPARVAGAAPVAYLFTGQGAQYHGMGRGLYDDEPVFRAVFDRCSEVLTPRLEGRLTDVCFSDDPGDRRIHQTGWAQPALFALELALVELWRSWGVEPAAVLGHSVGEYVAACVAGVMTVEDALSLLADRAALMQSLPTGGGMLAILAPEPEVRDLLTDALSIAAVNGPANVVVSGPIADLAAVRDRCGARQLAVVPLTVSHAFHSGLMEPVLERFYERAACVRFAAPRIPLIANLTGREADASIATPDYWTRQLRGTVRFAEGLDALLTRHEAFLEIGPRSILATLGAAAAGHREARWVASLERDVPDAVQVRRALGGLWEAGVAVDWPAFHATRPGAKTSMPTYPFAREPFWIEASLVGGGAEPRTGARDGALPGERVSMPDDDGRIRFETVLFRTNAAEITGTDIFDRTDVPASGHLATALRVARDAGVGDAAVVSDLEIVEPLPIRREGTTVQTVAARLPREDWGVQVFSLTNAWTLHATCGIGPAGFAPTPRIVAPPFSVYAAREDFYRSNDCFGVQYGAALRVVDRVGVQGRVAQATLSVPHAGPAPSMAVLDAGFQLLRAIFLMSAGRALTHVTRVGRCAVFASIPVDVVVTAASDEAWETGAIEIADARTGHIVAAIDAVSCASTPVDAPSLPDTEGRPASREANPERFLDRAIKTILRLPADRALDPMTPFGRLGLDSLMATQLSVAIQLHLGLAIPPARIIELGTLARLAGEARNREAGTPSGLAAVEARYVEGDL